MDNGRKDFSILIAEDDDDDYLLTQKALREVQFNGALHHVKDGEELMEFLLGGRWQRPGGGADGLLLLLDLNMPRKDGRQALKEIKSHPELKRIPTVVLTTSNAETDIGISYDLGANSFIRKPDGYHDFVEYMRALKTFWIEVAALPSMIAAGMKNA